MSRAPLWVVAKLHPHKAVSDEPGYAGTYPTRLQKMQFAEEISTGRRPMPIVLDHAGLENPRDAVPEEKRLGYWTHAWLNPSHDLCVVGELDPARPETPLLATALRRRHDYNVAKAAGAQWTQAIEPPPVWGTSIYGSVTQDTVTKKIVAHNLTHGGITIDPNHSDPDEATYITHWSQDKRAIAQTLRDKHWSAPGAFVPRAAREHWLADLPPPAAAAQGGAHSETGRGYFEHTLAATGGEGDDAMTSLLRHATDPLPTSMIEGSFAAPLRALTSLLMADAQQPPATSATATAPAPAAPAVPPTPTSTPPSTQSLPAPVPMQPPPDTATPSQDQREHNNKLYLLRIETLLKRTDEPSAAKEVQEVVRTIEEKPHLFSVTDPLFLKLLAATQDLKEKVGRVERNSREGLADLKARGLITGEHERAYDTLRSQAGHRDLGTFNELVVAATASAARSQKELEKRVLAEQALEKQILERNQEHEKERATLLKKLEDEQRERERELAALKAERDKFNTELEATKRRYTELAETMRVQPTAAPLPATTPASAAAKQADLTLAATGGTSGISSSDALALQQRIQKDGIFADPSFRNAHLSRLSTLTTRIAEGIRFDGFVGEGDGNTFATHRRFGQPY